MREQDVKCYTAQELANKLDVTLLTIYKWRARQGLPTVAKNDDDAPGQKYRFREDQVTDWLRARRPELLPSWNGEDARVTTFNAWTRRRLREAIRRATS